MKTYYQPMICCALGLTFTTMAPRLWANDTAATPSKIQAQIDALESTKDLVQDKNAYPRDEATNRRLKGIEDQIDALEKQRDEAEIASEEKAENKEELYEGNANHARDMIRAESDALQKRLTKASDAIDTSEKSCAQAGYDTLKTTNSFTYEQKVAHVDKFKEEAAMTLASLDQAARDMLYTYNDAREEMRSQKKLDKAEKVATTNDTPSSDPAVTEREEDTQEGNANHARDLIKEEADAIRKRLAGAVAAVKQAEETRTEAAFTQLKDDGKFPYKAKYDALNGFKEDAADALVSLHKDACEMLPQYRDETTVEVTQRDGLRKNAVDSPTLSPE